MNGDSQLKTVVGAVGVGVHNAWFAAAANLLDAEEIAEFASGEPVILERIVMSLDIWFANALASPPRRMTFFLIKQAFDDTGASPEVQTGTTFMTYDPYSAPTVGGALGSLRKFIWARDFVWPQLVAGSVAQPLNYVPCDMDLRVKRKIMPGEGITGEMIFRDGIAANDTVTWHTSWRVLISVPGR